MTAGVSGVASAVWAKAADGVITNPAATGQVLVSATRAVLRQRPGAYTLPEIPPVDFLPGDRESLLHRLI